METILPLLIPALIAVLLVKTLLMPLGWMFKLAAHSACGFLCLWLLNLSSGITGVFFPINAATILIAGALGLPGIATMALLAVM